MTWLDKLERRIGFLAIPGLLRYVGFLTALVFVLEKVNPGYLRLLDLDPVAVMHGEVWRLVTYIFIPQMASMLPLPDWVNVAFYILFLWWMGNGLESAWGAFKLTIFYVLGMIGTTIAAFFFGAAFSNLMLTTSLFFAFARFYPDLVIYFAYILPAEALHRCAICGATEVTDPNLEFRVARNGEEYCLPHLPKPQAAGTASSKSSG